MLMVFTPSMIVFSVSLSFSIFAALSSSSIFVLWVLMEAGVVFFIGLLASEQSRSSNALAKYFLSQGFIGLAFFLFFQVGAWLPPGISRILFVLLIICKLGVAPLHFWVVSVVSKASLESLFVFLGPQKVLPLVVCGWGVSVDASVFYVVGICSFLSSLCGYGYKGFNEILAFTSMVVVSWVLGICFLDSELGLVCFLLYCLLLGITFLGISVTESGLVGSPFGVLGLVFLAGAPPGPLFLTKWVFLCLVAESGIYSSVIFLFLAAAILAVPLYLNIVCLVLFNSGLGFLEGGYRLWGLCLMLVVGVSLFFFA